jgi:hypothetical protein
VKGFHMQRMFPAILAAAYSGTLYWQTSLLVLGMHVHKTQRANFCATFFNLSPLSFTRAFSSCPFQFLLEEISCIRWWNHPYDYSHFPPSSMYAIHGVDRRILLYDRVYRRVVAEEKV